MRPRSQPTGGRIPQTTSASAIDDWVAGRHLDRLPASGRDAGDVAGREDSRARFAVDGHLVLRRFLVADQADRVAAFLAEEANYQTRYGLYSARPRSVSEARWTAAGTSDRFYRHRKLEGARRGYEMSPNLFSFLQLRNALYDGAFRRLFEAMTGLELGGLSPLTARSYRCGDFLRPHTDDASGRQLALILYLSPGWRPENGGALRIADSRDDPSAGTKIEAEYNSVALLDVTAGAEHWVETVTDSAGDSARLTLSGWFGRRQRP